MGDFSSPAAKEQALKAARAAAKAEHWSIASSQFEAVYAEEQTPELNRELVDSLYHNEQYLRAEQYAAEMDAAYLSSQADFNLRLIVALKNRQFIFAREFCALSAAADWRDQGLSQIIQAEDESRTTLATTQRLLAKQFAHLGDVSFGEQRQRLEQARQLPLKEFMQSIQYLLIDPFLHPLIRATLLEELLRLRVKATVKLQWLDDQMYTIDTADLQPVNASRAAAGIRSYFQEDLGQRDPMMAANAQQTVTLQLMMLYPFIDKVVTQPTNWARLVAGEDLPPEVTADEKNDMIAWQQRLNRFMAELFGPLNGENAEKP